MALLAMSARHKSSAAEVAKAHPPRRAGGQRAPVWSHALPCSDSQSGPGLQEGPCAAAPQHHAAHPLVSLRTTKPRWEVRSAPTPRPLDRCVCSSPQRRCWARLVTGVPRSILWCSSSQRWAPLKPRHDLLATSVHFKLALLDKPRLDEQRSRVEAKCGFAM
jgi:hypothetical protein